MSDHDENTDDVAELEDESDEATDGDRSRILAVLDDPPRALVELRAVLFGELNWRREGLAPT